MESQFEEALALLMQTGTISVKDAERCMDLAEDAHRIREKELLRLPFHLNLIECCTEGWVKETAHSRFLWNMLRLPEFMDGFVRRFFGESYTPTENCRANHPDQYRMDISIEGETDFYIIENKVNDAPEQCGQIYRYVSHALRTYRADHIHVLYLNSASHDKPSAFSLSEDGEGKVFIPTEIALRVISYKDEIVDWLETMYPMIDEKEIYLKTAVFQYLDYLKEHFNINPIHKDMNIKITNMIKERLFTEGMNTLDKLNTIVDTKQQLEKLKFILDDLEKKGEAKRFQEWFDAIVERYPLDEYDWKRDNPTDIHIDFRYQGYGLAACLTIDEGLCWGIKSINRKLPQELIKQLRREIQKCLPKVQSVDWWPAWYYTSYENGLTRFMTLLECVFSIADGERDFK